MPGQNTGAGVTTSAFKKLKSYNLIGEVHGDH